jgi:hypothetical protein
VKFRRKSAPTEAEETTEASSARDGAAEAGGDASAAADDNATGPFDIDDVELESSVPRVDLGSLLIAPSQGREVRVQVDEATQAVQSVMIAGSDGALELRAFAAPRNGDLWSEVRPQIIADLERRGGTATERTGRFGPELVCERPVELPDGGRVVQPTRVVGVNGPRWFLRATFLGGPARSAESGASWEEMLAQVVVRRGGQAMPVADPLPITLPGEARRLGSP